MKFYKSFKHYKKKDCKIVVLFQADSLNLCMMKLLEICNCFYPIILVKSDGSITPYIILG